MKTACISAGHSLSDPGAVHRDLKEAELNMEITKLAIDMLRKHSVGALTVPDNLNLIQTIKWINERAGQIDLACEVHINAGGGTGVEAWHYAGSQTSKNLGEHIVNALKAETGLKNRGVKDETLNRWGRLGFVHDTQPLAILVECGFIDGDYDYLKMKENLIRIAKGIVRGILSFLGLPWKPELLEPPAEPEPEPDEPQPEPEPLPPTDSELTGRVEKLEKESVLQENRLAQVENKLKKVGEIL